ncbi:MAG TPA: HlyD family efflux transporter periplasmic adaptor subunit [Anaerolineales bacterium]|nr:HlyD family efflux transporter periplasmic adaptor subunit [Anaerolineales bacterium]
MKPSTKILIALITAALFLTACGAQTSATTAATATPAPSGTVIAEAHLKPVRATSLSFQAGGVVQDVNVKLGDQVKAGDVLLRLANADQAEAELVSAQQAYDSLARNASGDRAKLWQAYMDAQKARETAQKKWDDINVRDIENRIEDRQNDVEDRQTDLGQAQRDFDKYKDLNRDDPKYKDAQDKLDHAQSDYDIAVKNLESTMRERDVPRANLDAALAAEAEAKYQYDLTQNGPNTDELALAKARLATAQAALGNYEITAPFDGVVMALDVAVGDEANPQSWVIKIADTSTWYAVTSDLTELDVVNVSKGQLVTMTVDALPGLTMTGVVDSIAQASTTQGGDILYEVKVKLDQIDPRAMWGMTVEVTFKPSGEK